MKVFSLSGILDHWKVISRDVVACDEKQAKARFRKLARKGSRITSVVISATRSGAPA